MILKVVIPTLMFLCPSIVGISIHQLKNLLILSIFLKEMEAKLFLSKVFLDSLIKKKTLDLIKDSRRIKVCKWLKPLLKDQNKFQISRSVSFRKSLKTVLMLSPSNNLKKMQKNMKNKQSIDWVKSIWKNYLLLA